MHIQAKGRGLPPYDLFWGVMFVQAGREISGSLTLQRPAALGGGGEGAGGLGVQAWAYPHD